MILTDTTDGIRTITLNRPEARNALSLELIEALRDAVAECDRACRSGDVRVAVLAGAGKSFCAGMDLKGVIDDPARMGIMLKTLALTSLAIRSMPVPTIAHVQGAAVGGGCGLMVVCDFACTHPEAKVGYPEVDLGVCPAVVAPWLIRRIGAGRARAMLLAGGTMSGAEGHAAGLATHCVPPAELDGTVRALAARLAAGGPVAQAATKEWLNRLDGSADEATLIEAAAISARVIAGPEAQSRLRAVMSR
jgi:enoyl-CoA hydratase/carnithine racemase